MSYVERPNLACHEVAATGPVAADSAVVCQSKCSGDPTCTALSFGGGQCSTFHSTCKWEPPTFAERTGWPDDKMFYEKSAVASKQPADIPVDRVTKNIMVQRKAVMCVDSPDTRGTYTHSAWGKQVSFPVTVKGDIKKPEANVYPALPAKTKEACEQHCLGDDACHAISFSAQDRKCNVYTGNKCTWRRPQTSGSFYKRRNGQVQLIPSDEGWAPRFFYAEKFPMTHEVPVAEPSYWSGGPQSCPDGTYMKLKSGAVDKVPCKDVVGEETTNHRCDHPNATDDKKCPATHPSCRFNYTCALLGTGLTNPYANPSSCGGRMTNWARSCAPLTECTADEFESQPPGRYTTGSLKGKRSDRHCQKLTPPCGPTQYETPPTRTSDRICHSITVCGADEFESVPPTPTSDRTCQTITECADDEFELTPPTATSDRVCQTVTECTDDEFELTPPTATSDRVCKQMRDCAPDEFLASVREGICRKATVCGADQYETQPLRRTEDRACAPLTKCTFMEIEYKPPTATSDRVCKRGTAVSPLFLTNLGLLIVTLITFFVVTFWSWSRLRGTPLRGWALAVAVGGFLTLTTDIAAVVAKMRQQRERRLIFWWEWLVAAANGGYLAGTVALVVMAAVAARK